MWIFMTKQEQATIRKAMSLLGSKTSPKKAKSSRANGKLGGRGRKRLTKEDHARLLKEKLERDLSISEAIAQTGQ
jgi:hypothetical protein